MQPNKISYVLCALIAIASGFALYFYFSHRELVQVGTGDAPTRQHAQAASSGLIRLGGQDFRTDMADTPAKRQQGLSGRETLERDEAMLFVFEEDGYHAFWMKDMKFSIDMIWLDESMAIVHIERNVSPSSYPNTYKSPEPARYVLEVQAGTADRLNLQANDKAEW